MKNIFRTLLFTFLTVFAVSCESEDRRFDADYESGWVQFIDPSDASIVYGTANAVTLPAKLSTAINTSGLGVNYELIPVSGPFSQIFSSTEGTFNFGHGEIFADLEIPIINDVNITESVVFDVKLVSTSRTNVTTGIEGVDSKPIIKRVSVCPIAIAASYTGVPSIGADVYATFTVDFVAVEGQAHTYTVATAWGPNFIASVLSNPAYNGMYLYSGTIKIDTVAGTVVVTGNDAWAQGGTGTYDPCSGQIVYKLNQSLLTVGGQPAAVDVVLSPN